MDPDSFEKTIMNRRRQRDLSLYEGVILDWLRQYPGMTASQVLDWLKEHYSVAVSERTTRRFVEQLRKQHDLPKNTAKVRHYLAMEDPPMGRQMQVDLGVVHVKDARTISYRKLYCVACVLSHSRYKWGEWFTGPLTSSQLVAALEECFEYLGGMPAELVFDQDRLIAVDENYGDIIYTKEFEQFRLLMNEMRYLDREHFRVLLLNAKNRVLSIETVSVGTLNSSAVHPRELFKPAIRNSAAAVILVHNHPSGDPTPSRQDITVTERLKEVGEILGIEVLDHVIVGDGVFISFKEKGLL